MGPLLNSLFLRPPSISTNPFAASLSLSRPPLLLFFFLFFPSFFSRLPVYPATRFEHSIALPYPLPPPRFLHRTMRKTARYSAFCSRSEGTGFVINCNYRREIETARIRERFLRLLCAAKYEPGGAHSSQLNAIWSLVLENIYLKKEGEEEEEERKMKGKNRKGLKN